MVMSETANAMLMIAVLIVSVPAATLFVQVVVATFRRRSSCMDEFTAPPRIAVVVPAHNETKMLAQLLATVLPQLRDQDRVVVVADNCTDDTAAVGMKAGAEVLVRDDAQCRGKGFALDYGVAHLAQSGAPDVVIFVDADCEVAPGAIGKLAKLAYATKRPVQAHYAMNANPSAGLGARVSAFAVRLKNHVRPLGSLGLGAPCTLNGSGMAFPWAVLSSVQLATSNIVEDLALGIDLTLAGRPPLYCPEALVTSPLPSSDTGHHAQRQRWEQGHLSTIAHRLPRLLLSTIMRRSWTCLAAALDLIVVPLTLLVFAEIVCFAASACFHALGGSVIPVLIQCVSLCLMTSAIVMAWWTSGRDLLAGSDALYIPLYMLRKVPMYVSLVVGRRVGWVRSDRE
jgi:cellulose synthase/poly-beta-1,6-N-acetylglucosamine synthase-like glycosyltransferase